MSVNVETVKHIAYLARITFDKQEAEAVTAELNAVLDWGLLLDEADIAGIEPMVSPVQAVLPMRADKVTDGHKQADILANAPLTEEGFFLVPKVVE